MNLEALGNNVVVSPVRSANKTSGGVLLPQSQSGYEDGAVVLSVGPNVEGLVPGDVVVRPDPALFEMVDDATGEEFWMVSASDILAKIVEEVPQRFTHPPLGTIPHPHDVRAGEDAMRDLLAQPLDMCDGPGGDNVPAKTEG